MPDSAEKRRVILVSACMRSNGLPAFSLHEVEVTPEEFANGVQYDLAEQQLLADGFEEPFVHFTDSEGPSFLVPAVQQHLGLPPDSDDQTNPVLQEES
jgi:hypothetical protein